MCTLHKNIIINTPADRVWEVLSNPKLYARLNPNISDFTFTTSPAGGFEGNWNYALGKLKLRGKLRTVLFEPKRQLVVESCGQMKSKWSWFLETDGYWTHLSMSVEYTAKWSRVGAVLHESVLEYMHDETLGTYLHNIKVTVEKAHN